DLEVVDELRQVLDRVDVVVGWRRDERDAGRGAADGSDALADLVPRQLATLAGLGSLRHLDLQLDRVLQVVDVHAEAAGRDLLDRAVAVVAVGQRREASFLFAAFAGVRTTTEVVHRD